MPWIFLTLMLANIVYFGWSFISESQTPAQALSAPIVQEGARVMLLQEQKTHASTLTQPLVEHSGLVEDAPVVPERVAAQLQCFFVGPFASMAVAEQFAERMQGKGLQFRVDQRKAEGKDYWVYVPPFITRAKADERLAELRAKGVESFIVSEGSFANAISLGHFTKKELAQAFRGRLTAAGIVAEYRELASEGRVGWVYLAPRAAKTDSKAIIDAELLKNEALRKEAASCEE